MNAKRNAPGVATEGVPEVIAATETNIPLPFAAQAEHRRQRISLLLRSLCSQQEQLLALVSEARDNQDHLTLGYASWTTYVAEEFGGLLERLNREDRRSAALALNLAGMSSRAIAPIIGTSDRQVRRDLREVGHPVPPHRPGAPDGVGEEPDALADAVAGLRSVMADNPMPRKIVGTDGKTYTVPDRKPAPAPRKPSRRPLTEAHRDAVHDLGKIVERLVRLHADDRFPANRDTIADQGRVRLRRAAATLAELVADFDAAAEDRR